MDGELGLERSLEIEQHIGQCSACSGALEKQQALRTALANPSLYHPAPAHLRKQVQAALRRTPRRASPFPVPVVLLRSVAIAASVACIALLGWGLLRLLSSVPSPGDVLAEQVVSSHIRSLMPGNPLGVISSDQHTVKPWFNGKVDFSPPVKDLADKGYPLVGGRVDYFGDRKVAVLVYQRHKHVINLLVWPAAADTGEASRDLTRQGYHLVHWTDGGLTYWAISDVNEKELQEFVELIRR
jgi:anti-sigma factor RsiW